jgi:cation diffusion facilitator CzcD-associated flavoprotein CzcO
VSTLTAPDTPAAELPTREVRVAIVGAGFGGIGAAIKLREAGIDDLVILERASALGGTWQANTYPGCACDVPSHLYSYSFALNPDWTRFFAPQREILAYLERVARESGVAGRIVYGAEVTGAEWDEDARRWRLETAAGPVVAQAVVAASGPLSEPSIPDIEGLGRFRGTMFHSAAWDHRHSLAGERVAVIGTGASAAQFVPHVQREAAHLDVYQRTAGWILPRGDREIPRAERRLLRRVPAVQRALRNAIYYIAELLVVGLVIDKRVLSVFEAVAHRKLRKEVPDPELRARLTPSFRIGCKRIIFSDDYLPALSQPNVELVTDPIAEVDATGIRTADGTHRPVDTIILGTGFRVWDSPIAERLVGRDGRSLAQAWAEGGPQAYLGTVIAGFPNLFFLIGPNTGLGNNSMINIIEGQLVFLVDALRAMDETGAAALDVHRAVQDRYNAGIQAAMVGTVWTDGGCNSWYLSEDGSNRTLWPSFSNAFKRRLAGFDIADFRITPQVERRAPLRSAAAQAGGGARAARPA